MQIPGRSIGHKPLLGSQLLLIVKPIRSVTGASMLPTLGTSGLNLVRLVFFSKPLRRSTESVPLVVAVGHNGAFALCIVV